MYQICANLFICKQIKVIMLAKGDRYRSFGQIARPLETLKWFLCGAKLLRFFEIVSKFRAFHAFDQLVFAQVPRILLDVAIPLSN